MKVSKRKTKASEVSQEMFDEALTELLEEASAAELLSIPGLYEVVSEHYNNEAIERAKHSKED